MPRKKTTRKTTTRKTTARKTTARKTATRKTTARKKTAKRVVKRATTTRKTAAKKVTKKAAPKPIKLSKTPVREPFRKSQVFGYLADNTELSKKEITQLFETLGNLMERHLKKRGPGEFTIPGLMKCVVKRKPATKSRQGINPFTGEPTTFKAKPARNVIKVRPLKKLKEMAES